MRRDRLVNIGLLAAVIAIFALPFALNEDSAATAAGEAFSGSDDQAELAVEQADPGYKPWFSPVFEPGSGEVESGLFALQAAVGAGAFGFAMGRLSGRRQHAGHRTGVAAQSAPETQPAPDAQAAAHHPGVPAS
jgi:cobalt/nickel transport protein